MKKDTFIKIIGAFSIMLVAFLFIEDALAFKDDSEKIVEEGRAIKVCEYVDKLNNNEIRGRIYYVFPTTGDGAWQVKGRVDDTSDMVPIIITQRGKETNYTYGSFTKVFSNNTSSRIFYEKKDNFLDAGKENSFTCPKNFFINNSNQTKFCLGDSESCGKDFVKGPFKLDTENKDTIFNIIDTAAVNLLSSDDYIDDIINNEKFTDKWREKIKSFVVGKYNLDSKSNIPNFIVNYIDKKGIDETDSKVMSEYNKLKEKALEDVDKKVEKGEMTEEEAEKTKNRINESSVEDFVATSIKGSFDLNINDKTDCQGLLGPDVSKIVKNLFTFIQYLGPVLIAVFSIMDFVKASVAGDEGQLKKAGERLGKRIVCGILLFFVPLICSILLDFGGITLTDTCIEQYGSKETSK